MSAKLDIANLNNLISRYLAGESLKQLSDETGIVRLTLTNHFRRAGVPIRGRHDAERLKWQTIRQHPNGVEQQLRAAWDASRGRIVPMHTKRQRAQTNFINQSHIGLGETDLANEFSSRGWTGYQQFPVGPYNLDLAFSELCIAVEVFGRQIGKSRRSAKPERIEYIADLEWLQLFVVDVFSVFVPAHIVDYMIPLLEKRGRNEAICGQYGMVRGNGERYPGPRFNAGKLTRIPGF